MNFLLLLHSRDHPCHLAHHPPAMFPMLPAPISPALAMAPSLTAMAFPRRPFANPMAPPSWGTSPFSPTAALGSLGSTASAAGSPPAGAAPGIFEDTNPEIWFPIPESIDIVELLWVESVADTMSGQQRSLNSPM